MSEMIERVADAMGAAIVKQEGVGNLVGGYDEGNGDIAVEGIIDLKAVARAAIEEIRRPTEAMITAGERHTDSYYSEDGDFMQGWQAAFNEALGETP